MVFYQGIDSIERISKIQQTYLTEKLFPKEDKAKFYKNRILIGHNSSGEFWLDIREVHRTLILGATRCGKTMLLRRIMDLFALSGFHVVFLSDVKNEMKSSSKPQSKYSHLLSEKDQPVKHKLKVYRPVFFEEYFHERRADSNTPFQINYKECQLYDLLNALRIDNENQSRIVELLWNQVDSLEGLRDKIRNYDFSQRTKKTLLMKVEALIKVGAFGDDHNHDIVKDMQNGEIPVLNLQKHDRIVDKFSSLSEVYMMILQRKIVEARGNNELPERILVIIDEASKFLREKTLSKEDLMRAVDLYAGLGIYMYFATQTADQVPLALIQQSRYIFLPYNISVDTAMKILREKQYYGWHPSFIQRVINSLREMKKKRSGERQWLIVDSDTKEISKVWTYPSLSRHQESS